MLPAASATKPPRVAKLTRGPRARQDLIDIWTYIADDNEAAADGVLARIERALAMLADNPAAGRVRPELAEGLRSFSIGNTVLFYLPTGTGIELVRALSGYRDISADDFEA